MSFASCADLTALESQLTTLIDANKVLQATESLAGKVELATQLEAALGTDRTRAVTPYSLKYALDDRFAEELTPIAITQLLGEGISGNQSTQTAIAESIADELIATDTFVELLANITPNLRDCDGNALEANDQVATCNDLALAITGVTIPDATTTVKGKVELATNTEAIACTSMTVVLTPAAAKAQIDAAIAAALASQVDAFGS